MKAVVAHALNELSVVDVNLDLDRMVTRTYRIDEAPQAFDDLERGANARGVIVYD